MKKIDKEYYEKLKAINYNKVETTLYEKLKDYGIWEVKERIEKADDYLLFYNNRIEYIKKYIKKNIMKMISQLILMRNWKSMKYHMGKKFFLFQ